MNLRVKEVCKEKGTTITGLADRLGMKQVSLSRIINGNPTIGTLQKIADALGVSLVELFEAKRENTPNICSKCGMKIKAATDAAAQPIPTQLPDIGLLEYFDKAISEKRAMGEVNRARQFGTIRNALEKYSGEVSMRSVSNAYIDGFSEYMQKIPLSDNTQYTYLSWLHNILAQAKEQAT